MRTYNTTFSVHFCNQLLVHKKNRCQNCISSYLKRDKGQLCNSTCRTQIPFLSSLVTARKCLWTSKLQCQMGSYVWFISNLHWFTHDTLIPQVYYIQSNCILTCLISKIVDYVLITVIKSTVEEIIRKTNDKFKL